MVYLIHSHPAASSSPSSSVVVARFCVGPYHIEHEWNYEILDKTINSLPRLDLTHFSTFSWIKSFSAAKLDIEHDKNNLTVLI